MNVEMVPKRRMDKAVRRAIMAPDGADLFGDHPPEALLTPYPGLEGKRMKGVQGKYLDRRRNILRCWNRAQLYTPELLQPGAPRRRVLELSTAHGAMLEIYRHLGHEVLGADYANFEFEGADPNARQRDAERVTTPAAEVTDKEISWPYREFVEAIDLPVILFDAGRTPYPLDDKSQDYLLTFQAMEHYCHPSAWNQIITEFCRITTTAIVIMINPLHPHLAQIEGYTEAFDEARQMMRNWNACGFQCTSVHIQWGDALGFKFMQI